jgi:hypothetical protein
MPTNTGFSQSLFCEKRLEIEKARTTRKIKEYFDRNKRGFKGLIKISQNFTVFLRIKEKRKLSSECKCFIFEKFRRYKGNSILNKIKISIARV